jgi:hypothetical protein
MRPWLAQRRGEGEARGTAGGGARRAAAAAAAAAHARARARAPRRPAAARAQAGWWPARPRPAGPGAATLSVHWWMGYSSWGRRGWVGVGAGRAVVLGAGGGVGRRGAVPACEGVCGVWGVQAGRAGLGIGDVGVRMGRPWRGRRVRAGRAARHSPGSCQQGRLRSRRARPRNRPGRRQELWAPFMRAPARPRPRTRMRHAARRARGLAAARSWARQQGAGPRRPAARLAGALAAALAALVV